MSEPWKDFERRTAAHARDAGFTAWERRLRGGSHQDLLDLDGCLPDGWLVGCKSVRRGVTVGTRLSQAMDQCHAAMHNLQHYRINPEGVIPVQVLQRPGRGIGQAYVVTEYDWFLELALQRRRWEQ